MIAIVWFHVLCKVHVWLLELRAPPRVWWRQDEGSGGGTNSWVNFAASQYGGSGEPAGSNQQFTTFPLTLLRLSLASPT